MLTDVFAVRGVAEPRVPARSLYGQEKRGRWEYFLFLSFSTVDDAYHSQFRAAMVMSVFIQNYSAYLNLKGGVTRTTGFDFCHAKAS
jgi:hypothetical protein